MSDLSGWLRRGVALGVLVLATSDQALAQAGSHLPPVTIAPPEQRARPATPRGVSAPTSRRRAVRASRQSRGAPVVARAAPTQPVAAPLPALAGGSPNFAPGTSGRGLGSPLVAGPTTTTTTREELDRLQIQSIQDLGRQVEAGVSFNRNNNSINIRGLEGTRVLTTIDGIRQSFLTDTRVDRGSTNAFDFDFLSSIDVLRGPSGSSVIGPGALGGALAVRTLDPKMMIRPGTNFGAIAKTGYDTMDKAWFAGAAAAAKAGNTYFLLQGNMRDGEEVQTAGRLPTVGTSRTKANPSEFLQYGFLGKVHHYVDDVHRFGITGEYFKRDDRTTPLNSTVSLTGNYRPYAYFSGEDVERKRVSLTYDYKQPGGWLDEASAHLYWQNVTRHSLARAHRFTSVIGPYARDNQYEESTFGFNGHVSKGFTTGVLNHFVTLGTELRTTSLTQYSAGYDNCSVAFVSACNNLHTNQADMPKVDGAMVGIYAQDKIGLLNDRLRITPGARFDWYEERPQTTAAYTNSGSRPVGLPPSSSDSAFSPRVRVEYDILKNTAWLGDVTAFAQWAKGFRPPSANELYGRFGAVGTYLRVGNPDLKPERSDGIDVGLRVGNNLVGGSVTYFHTEYSNFIEQLQTAPPGGLYPQGGITSFRNISRAEIQGVEANGHYSFAPNWRVRGSFSYVRGINKDTGTFLNSISPMQGIVGLAYDTGVWGTEVSAKMASRRDDVAAVSGSLQGFRAPGYTIFNLTGWWQPVQMPNVQFFAGVYNIFDRKYFDAVTVPTGVLSQPRDYYSEPGRTFKVTMKYQF